jgi:hypothetical protein
MPVSTVRHISKRIVYRKEYAQQNTRMQQTGGRDNMGQARQGKRGMNARKKKQ